MNIKRCGEGSGCSGQRGEEEGELEGTEKETKSDGKCAEKTTNKVHGERLRATQSRLPGLAGA